MDTPFEKLDADTRREWRAEANNQALIDTIVHLRGGVVAQVVSAVKNAEREPETLAELGGRLNQIDDILLIIRRDK
jgi:hypothetical protein